jgi:phosphate transport system protein
MFKQLISLIKKGDLFSQAFDDAHSMLVKSELLYNEAVKALLANKSAGFDIYELDREINSLEKKIRRKSLEHLSINPQQDIVASLVLTSIVIDVERIGDYSKNIYELHDLYGKPEKITIENKLIDYSSRITELFEKVKNVFIDEDEKEAATLMNKLNKIKRGCDKYIFDVASKKDCSARRTIVNVLFSRYLKRVSAHLENMMSSIANPFDMIGFYQGDMNKEAD